MEADDIDDATRASNKEQLDRECGNLLAEVRRLEQSRSTLDFRVQNVQRLVSADIRAFLFSLLIQRSRYTQVSISKTARL